MTEVNALITAILRKWWYYSIELSPGIFTPGAHGGNYSSPRHALAKIDVAGLRCLDVGTMEGLVPTLWVKQGARQVVALDGMAHCMEKIDIVKKYHDVTYDYLLLPPAANAYDYLESIEFAIPQYNPPIAEGYREFDVVNLSGVLYHVWSPLHWLAAFRPLVKEGGLMVVSTHLLDTEQPVMEMNIKGRFQNEPDTFWYISPAVLHYMLNMLGLKPIDCIGGRSAPDSNRKTDFIYASVVCRAVDGVVAHPDDNWIAAFFDRSLELKSHARRKTFLKPGHVPYNGVIAADEREIDLTEAIHKIPADISEKSKKYNYILKLTDRE